MSTGHTWILPFDSDQADLKIAGGKGANLSRLVLAGFPVPDGFLINTDAYHLYVSGNPIAEKILAILPKDANAALETLEKISHQIRLLFYRGSIPEPLANQILAGYHQMGAHAVAVRSSATAEDLPDLSFAGQQDTYLNVLGDENLLHAVVDCWSSLWTARAIGYRLRNRVSHTNLSLAVIVQQMVESRASGVLFTSNPLTGLRTETVIDAALGLGEALVSGRVEPDHYVVDPKAGRILSKSLGRKSLSIHGQGEGGTFEQTKDRSTVQALPDEQILALAGLGEQVELRYGFPQDIEWAWANERLYLLQTRPITSLYPLPAGMPADPLQVMFSFAAIQGLMDPITPIGQDTLQWISAIVSKQFDRRKTRQTQSVFWIAGERIWVNITAIIRNSFGRNILPVVLDMVEPTVRQAVRQIQDDPRLLPGRQGVSLPTQVRLARFFLPLAVNIVRNLAAPQKRRRYIVDHGESVLQRLEADCLKVSGDRWEKLVQRAQLFIKILENDLPHTFFLFVSGVASGVAAWNIMKTLAAGRKTQNPATAVKANELALQVTRGMPYNPTTEMDLDLWKVAKDIRSDPEAFDLFQICSPRDLSTRYLAGALPGTVMTNVGQFLQRYGGRGFGEIDLGRTRWAEDPAHVFEMISSFLQIKDETQAPDVVFARSADAANQAVEHLVDLVKDGKAGWFKARMVRFMANRARQLMGLRESPKFFAVRLMWIIHRELLRSGKEFWQAGDLDQPDAIFFLRFDELRSLASRHETDWRSLIAERRAAYQREQGRRQIPRLLLSDGRAFYEGINDLELGENSLNGSPVSAGTVEGRVRVVLDPRQANLEPGEILVCPGTDPSWTPLFLSAGGLVMETGGMMTHGAVVAREYGIPAVVGVDKATQRLHTGQRIRIDGSSGLIVIQEDT